MNEIQAHSGGFFIVSSITSGKAFIKNSWKLFLLYSFAIINYIQNYSFIISFCSHDYFGISLSFIFNRI